ncbi:MAG: hypothetical protein AB1758_08130 [Candidatus Eremiobacterota bacterium]
MRVLFPLAWVTLACSMVLTLCGLLAAVAANRPPPPVLRLEATPWSSDRTPAGATFVEVDQAELVGVVGPPPVPVGPTQTPERRETPTLSARPTTAPQVAEATPEPPVPRSEPCPSPTTSWSLQVDGRAFLPRGFSLRGLSLSESLAAMEAVAGAGFNTVELDVGLDATSRAQVERAESLGLKVLAHTLGPSTRLRDGYSGTAVLAWDLALQDQQGLVPLTTRPHRLDYDQEGNPVAVPDLAGLTGLRLAEDQPVTYRTASSPRNQAFAVLIAGAHGFVAPAYRHGTTWKVPADIWADYQTLSWEIQLLEPVLLEGTRVELDTGNSDLWAATWSHQESLYLAVVNRAVLETCPLSLPLQGASLEPVTGGQGLGLSDGVVSGEVPAGDVQVYRLTR